MVLVTHCARSKREPKVAKHTYRWWDGDVYRQATFTTKADKADFVTEVRRRRRLGLSLSFEPEEHDPRLDEFIEDYWRLHAIPHLGHATRRTYEQEWVKWILPRLGSYQLRQLSARMIVRQLVEPTVSYTHLTLPTTPYV